MPNFGYTAIDKSGVEVKGSINAEDKEKIVKFYANYPSKLGFCGL